VLFNAFNNSIIDDDLNLGGIHLILAIAVSSMHSSSLVLIKFSWPITILCVPFLGVVFAAKCVYSYAVILKENGLKYISQVGKN